MEELRAQADKVVMLAMEALLDKDCDEETVALAQETIFTVDSVIRELSNN
jgi:hypothetical protein